MSLTLLVAFGRPVEYRWSSYHANALGKHDGLVHPHSQYLALDKNTTNRQSMYRALFMAHIDEITLEAIRQSTQKGWALGNDRFKDEMEQLIKRRTRPLDRGGDRRSIEFKKRSS